MHIGTARKGIAVASKGGYVKYPSIGMANIMLICCMIGYALSMLDRQILALMVDLVKSDLHLTDFQIGLCQGPAFATLYSLLIIPSGILADRVNRTRIVAIAMVSWSLATAACGLATSFGGLFVARMGVGIGEAVLIPAAYSILSDSFVRSRLVTAMAIFGIAGLAGAGLAMLIGGVMVDWVSHAAKLPFGLSHIAPWRIVFALVGVPGLFLAGVFLLLPEPTRKSVIRDEAGAAKNVSVRETISFLWARRRIYIPLYALPVLFGTIVNGAFNWFPALLIRNFGLSYSQAGAYAGIMQLGGAFLGAAIGPCVARAMTASGHRDAHLRALLALALATMVPVVVAPLIPYFPLMVPVWFLGQVLLGGYMGVSMAGLQLRTPNQMRALNTALCVFLAAILGAGLGPPFVGAMASYVFHDGKALGYGMAVLNVVCAPMAILLVWSGLKAHREDDLRLDDE